MFNFIKARLGGSKTSIETQRQTIKRAMAEVNEIVALLVDKPKVIIDPSVGSITLELPDQIPDEALALPAPEVESPVASGETDETPETDVKA
jgi:hypothetical protein